MVSSSTLPPSDLSETAFFIKSQFRTRAPPIPKSVTFANQTAIVTGANGAIGLEACKAMLDRKLARLVMAVRNTAKGEAAAGALREAFPGARIDVWELDMVSYDSITAFAKRCGAELGRVDVAILNAGLVQQEFKVVEGPRGHEEIFQVNYLSNALLSFLLLPLLAATRPGQTTEQKPGRLTIVTSGLALSAVFPNRDAVPLIPSFDVKPDVESVAVALERYNVAKLLLLMLVEKLGEVVPTGRVVVNVVDPGFIKTSGLHSRLSLPLRLAFGVFKMIAGRPLAQGASTYVDAVAVQSAESHGSFLVNWQIWPFHRMMYTDEGKKTSERLWEETLAELDFAGVKNIVDAIRAK